MADSDESGCSNPRPEYFIIREIYENEHATEDFENELERALEEEVETIIIEPSRLGDETARWITLGNWLHKTAVVSGASCLGVGFGLPNQKAAYLTLGSISTLCFGLYTASWQFDPCVKYQVECDARRLQRLPLHNLASSSPVVLMRVNDRIRNVLHSTISLSALAFCGFKVYLWLKD